MSFLPYKVLQEVSIKVKLWSMSEISLPRRMLVKTSKASLDFFVFIISKDNVKYIFLIREETILCYKT